MAIKHYYQFRYLIIHLPNLDILEWLRNIILSAWEAMDH